MRLCLNYWQLLSQAGQHAWNFLCLHGCIAPFLTGVLTFSIQGVSRASWAFYTVVLLALLGIEAHSTLGDQGLYAAWQQLRCMGTQKT